MGGEVVSVGGVLGRPWVLSVVVVGGGSVCVELGEDSGLIRVGDFVCWDVGWVLWTPRGARLLEDGGEGGVDFDIHFRRVDC